MLRLQLWTGFEAARHKASAAIRRLEIGEIDLSCPMCCFCKRLVLHPIPVACLLDRWSFGSRGCGVEVTKMFSCFSEFQEHPKPKVDAELLQ